MLAVAGIAAAAPAQQKEVMNMKKQNNHRILVACFSATGTTARVARMLADAVGGELYAITPAQPYTSADLNWRDSASRSSVEMDNPKSRPALKGAKVDMSAYDVVFIGYPVWWDQAPRIVNTFIEANDMKGCRVIPFATSGSSGIANSAAALKSAYPDLDWGEGRLLNGADARSIRQWLDRLGY